MWKLARDLKVGPLDCARSAQHTELNFICVLYKWNISNTQPHLVLKTSMGSNIRVPIPRYPCGPSGFFSARLADSGQRLEHFEVLNVWHTLRQENNTHTSTFWKQLHIAYCTFTHKSCGHKSLWTYNGTFFFISLLFPPCRQHRVVVPVQRPHACPFGSQSSIPHFSSTHTPTRRDGGCSRGDWSYWYSWLPSLFTRKFAMQRCVHLRAVSYFGTLLFPHD